MLQLNVEDRKREANWFDVGIIKGTSCTVSSYYLPNGDLEKSEIDLEVSAEDALVSGPQLHPPFYAGLREPGQEA